MRKDNTLSKAILFIATHPDDETLGCGGAIFKHKKNKDDIYWLIVTRGHEKEGFSRESIGNMEKQIFEVSQLCDFKEIFKLDFPATLLDAIPVKDIIGAIGTVIQNVKPDVIYIPHHNDVHSDHGVVFKSSWSCVKSFRAPFVKAVYTYETVSETEMAPPFGGNNFTPNAFCDISDYMSDKIKLAQIYKSEISPHPFPRSVENLEALAKFRGATIGVEYAESFMCLKRIF